MITIPKKVEYSIVFISYLAKNKGKSLSLSEASKKLYLPYRFLGQLAKALREAKIVESKEGKLGGYSLNPNWSKKTLYDLVEALGENKRMVKCLDSRVACVREANCELRGIWNKVETSFINELKKIKLAEI
ncbi:Rrf2 family transcriptional regulator [Candidatus Shapirobacteria bacterium]|nr:Rrf2 family transcriptional regulator [Candidatus Shapirobacteria bacterium]